jgi:hypothetical protein
MVWAGRSGPVLIFGEIIEIFRGFVLKKYLN